MPRFFIVAICVGVSVVACLDIAIIGAGIGGASAAFFIRELIPEAKVTVFERNEMVGGRLRSFTYNDTNLELGGSIGVKANQYFHDIATQFNLTVTSPLSVPGPYAVFNGTDIIFQTSVSSLVSLPKMLYQYGLGHFLVAPRVTSLVSDFNQIYNIQDSGIAFRSSTDLWNALSLLLYTKHSLKDVLLQSWLPSAYPFVSSQFVDEFVSSITHINYLQSPDTMHSLVGQIGLAPLYAKGEVFRIKEGNSQLVSRMLKESGSILLLNHSVTKLSQFYNKEFDQIQWNVTIDGDHNDHTFDKVIIATPLESAKIKLEGDAISIPPERDYQRLHTTIVQGRIQPEYFGRDSIDKLPTTVGATANSPFASFSILMNLENEGHVVKLFSENELDDIILQSLFKSGYKILTTAIWDAYPKYYAGQYLPEFILSNGLYYLNAIESGGSCIEISSISGRNAALLLKQDLNRTNSVPNQDATPSKVAEKIEL